VLIAIEILLNIVIFWDKNMFQVKLVVATALTAVARKVIVTEYTVDSAPLIYTLAAICFALGTTYWLCIPARGGRRHRFFFYLKYFLLN